MIGMNHILEREDVHHDLIQEKFLQSSLQLDPNEQHRIDLETQDIQERRHLRYGELAPSYQIQRHLVKSAFQHPYQYEQQALEKQPQQSAPDENERKFDEMKQLEAHYSQKSKLFNSEFHNKVFRYYTKDRLGRDANADLYQKLASITGSHVDDEEDLKQEHLTQLTGTKENANSQYSQHIQDTMAQLEQKNQKINEMNQQLTDLDYLAKSKQMIYDFNKKLQANEEEVRKQAQLQDIQFVQQLQQEQEQYQQQAELAKSQAKQQHQYDSGVSIRDLLKLDYKPPSGKDIIDDLIQSSRLGLQNVAWEKSEAKVNDHQQRLQMLKETQKQLLAKNQKIQAENNMLRKTIGTAQDIQHDILLNDDNQYFKIRVQEVPNPLESSASGKITYQQFQNYEMRTSRVQEPRQMYDDLRVNKPNHEPLNVEMTRRVNTTDNSILQTKTELLKQTGTGTISVERTQAQLNLDEVLAQQDENEKREPKKFKLVPKQPMQNNQSNEDDKADFFRDEAAEVKQLDEESDVKVEQKEEYHENDDINNQDSTKAEDNFTQNNAQQQHEENVSQDAHFGEPTINQPEQELEQKQEIEHVNVQQQSLEHNQVQVNSEIKDNNTYEISDDQPPDQIINETEVQEKVQHDSSDEQAIEQIDDKGSYGGNQTDPSSSGALQHDIQENNEEKHREPKSSNFNSKAENLSDLQDHPLQSNMPIAEEAYGMQEEPVSAPAELFELDNKISTDEDSYKQQVQKLRSMQINTRSPLFDPQSVKFGVRPYKINFADQNQARIDQKNQRNRQLLEELKQKYESTKQQMNE